jgi:phosphopantetheine attachment domain protein
MREEIIKIIAEILKKDVLEIEAGLDDVNTWDSLNRVEIMFAVEDEYGITFEEEDLPEISTPAKFIALAIKKAEE